MEEIKTYEQILKLYGRRDAIPYSELLKTVEWKEKRQKILNRDGRTCCNCKMSETIYENRSPYHFFLEDMNYEPIFDEFGIIVHVQPNLILIPAPRAVVLHVHHTYYFFDRNPWDYLDEALMTLCSHCHFELHSSVVMEWFDADSNSKKLTPCPRCNGAGRLPQFSHVKGGECFYCKGAMYIELMR